MKINFTKITQQRFCQSKHTFYCNNDAFKIKLFRERLARSVWLCISVSSRPIGPGAATGEQRALQSPTQPQHTGPSQCHQFVPPVPP